MPFHNTDKITVWPLKGNNEYGELEYEDPVELECRWDERMTTAVDLEGREFMAKSRVYYKTALADLDRGYLVLRKPLEDLEPKDREQALKVRTRKEDQSTRGGKKLFTAYLE